MAESAPKKRKTSAKKKTEPAKAPKATKAAAPKAPPKPKAPPEPAPAPAPKVSLVDSIVADSNNIALVKMERDLIAAVSRQAKRPVSREEIYFAMVLEYKKQCASYGPAALAHRLFQQLKLAKRV